MNNLGEIYSKKEAYSIAFSYYNKAIAVKENASIFFSRGETFLKRRDTINAEKDFYRAIELDSTFYLAYMNLGLLSFEQSDFKKSILLFDKAYNSFSLRKSTFSDKDLKSIIVTYRGLAKIRIGNIEDACIDWSLDINKDNDMAKKLINQHCK